MWRPAVLDPGYRFESPEGVFKCWCQSPTPSRSDFVGQGCNLGFGISRKIPNGSNGSYDWEPLSCQKSGSTMEKKTYEKKTKWTRCRSIWFKVTFFLRLQNCNQGEKRCWSYRNTEIQPVKNIILFPFLFFKHISHCANDSVFFSHRSAQKVQASWCDRSFKFPSTRLRHLRSMPGAHMLHHRLCCDPSTCLGRIRSTGSSIHRHRPLFSATSWIKIPTSILTVE